MRTRGQLEAEICHLVTQFFKECLGRGPAETKAFLLADMVLVRCRDVLLTPERRLLAQPDPGRGRDAVKQTRREVVEAQAGRLQAAVGGVLGVEALGLHYDLSTRADECILVMRLAGPAPHA